MKNLILFLFMFSCLSLFPQRGTNTIGAEAPGGPLAVISHWTRVDYAKFVVPKKGNDIKGNKYAFKDWNNKGLLSVDGENYKFRDINFNMRTNSIETQVGKDSVYIFDLKNVDHALINSRKFKSYYHPKKKKREIFELLFESSEFDFIKGYEVGVKRPEVDPAMVRKPVAKYFTTKRFYIKKLNTIEEISLKKKNIMPLFNDEKDKMLTYIKMNKLSFKRDDDLNKMFNYYSSLKK